MNIALMLAWLKKGTTSPNPTVGAVLVKNRQILSTGVTQSPGYAHAEKNALETLSVKKTSGATLYVTLEPCCFYGKTPPCTDIILEKKIKRVVIAALDPNPKVYCKGMEMLKAQGIQVDTGLLEKKAIDINRDFNKWIVEKTPFITLKYAMTLDGKMAAPSGDSKWITNERARNIAHILRYRSDAILVGVNTVIQDNPVLNARLYNREKTLYRIILDPKGETPLNANVMQDKLPTLFVVKKNLVSPTFINTVKNIKNKEIFEDSSHLDNIQLLSLMKFLGEEKNIVSLFVEGGSSTLGSFMNQGLGDRVFIFLGDQILGEGLTPFSGLKKNYMRDSIPIQDIKIKKLANNILIYGKLEHKNS